MGVTRKEVKWTYRGRLKDVVIRVRPLRKWYLEHRFEVSAWTAARVNALASEAEGVPVRIATTEETFGHQTPGQYWVSFGQGGSRNVR